MTLEEHYAESFFDMLETLLMCWYVCDSKDKSDFAFKEAMAEWILSA